MKILKRKQLLGLIFVGLIILSFIPMNVGGWHQSTNISPSRTSFTTHQWLSFEAITMFPEQKIQWITNNIHAFWDGVKAPFDAYNSNNYEVDNSTYGDINGTILYLDAAGVIVTNDSLAQRAQIEYDKALVEMSNINPNYTLAAFYAGTMSHYIAQAGSWGAIWDDSLWGPLIYYNWSLYEEIIDNDLSEVYFPYNTDNFLLMDFAGYYNEHIALTPEIPTQIEDAYNATISLAKNIHPDAQYLGDNINMTQYSVLEWSEEYQNKTKDCLTYSVEAVYSAIEKLMIESDWAYLELPTPIYTFNESVFKLSIPEFQVDYYHNETAVPLNNSIVEFAQVRYLYYNEYNEPSELSTDSLDLQYNDSSEKWFLSPILATGTVALSNHSLIYVYKLTSGFTFWSDFSSRFYINYISYNFSDIYYYYNSSDRTIDIGNITLNCPDVPDIGFVNETEAVTAQWYLYIKAIGPSPTGEIFGVPVYDTEGNLVYGNMTYFPGSMNWSSINNDIGLVYTPDGTDHYIVIRFTLEIPVGYYKETLFEPPIFRPYAQTQGIHYFRTKDHEITINKPAIEYSSEIKILNVYNVTAVTDYRNTVLDYYEIYEKEIFDIDRREARWKIIDLDNPTSMFYLTGNLLWNASMNYWYVNDIDISALDISQYVVVCKFSTQNTNFTATPWGPESDSFGYPSSGSEKLPPYLIGIFIALGVIVVPLSGFGIFQAIKSSRKRKTQLTEKDSSSDKYT
ncbi:MAG: hypothetical protein ACTSO7_15700 [Candidatus Heimdallarchaeota archaeon]